MKIYKKFKDEERRTDPKRKPKKISKKRNLDPLEYRAPKHRKIQLEE